MKNPSTSKRCGSSALRELVPLKEPLRSLAFGCALGGARRLVRRSCPDGSSPRHRSIFPEPRAACPKAGLYSWRSPVVIVRGPLPARQNRGKHRASVFTPQKKSWERDKGTSHSQNMFDGRRTKEKRPRSKPRPKVVARGFAVRDATKRNRTRSRWRNRWPRSACWPAPHSEPPASTGDRRYQP